MKVGFAAIVSGLLLIEIVVIVGEPAPEDVLHQVQFRRRAYGTTNPKRIGNFLSTSKDQHQSPTSSGPLTIIKSMQILSHSANSNANSIRKSNNDDKAITISVPGIPAKVFHDISRSALRRLTDTQLSLLLKKHSKSDNSQIIMSRSQMIEKLLTMAASASANIIKKAEKQRSRVIPTSSLEPSVLHLQRTTVPASTASPIHFHRTKTVPRVTIRTNKKLFTDEEMNSKAIANPLSTNNKLSTSKLGSRHKVDEWDSTSKMLTGNAKRLKALALTLSQVRATYDKLRNEYLKLYKEFKSTNTTHLSSKKLISGDHSNIDSPLLHINKSRILGNLKALTRLTGMLSHMINAQKKNDGNISKFQTSKITKTSMKNLNQGHKNRVHKNGEIEKKTATSISEVKQLSKSTKQKEQHSKPHRNTFKSTRIYPERTTNEDRHHEASSETHRKASKTTITTKKIDNHSKNQGRAKLGVHNAEKQPIKVESATKTAEVPRQTPPPIDETIRKEIPQLISDIEASDNGHIVENNESALKLSSTKKDSFTNVNILSEKAQPIKGTGQSADSENSIEDLVENLKKEYQKIGAPRAMPIPKSFIEDDEKEAISSVTSTKPIIQPTRPTLKLKEKTQHAVKSPLKVDKWKEETSMRTAEACELVECDFEEGSLCSYESTKDELSPSSRHYIQRTRRSTHKIRRSWHNWRGRYRNRLTGIAHSKIFSASNKRFAAAYVRPHQWAALSTKLISGEAETIRFRAWEATLDVQLRGCCNTTDNCPFHTELGASRQSRKWMEWSFTCPKGTSKLIFLCENQGINQGACGIDNIFLASESCKSLHGTLRHVEGHM